MAAALKAASEAFAAGDVALATAATGRLQFLKRIENMLGERIAVE